jgi:hypothetical protein
MWKHGRLEARCDSSQDRLRMARGGWGRSVPYCLLQFYKNNDLSGIAATEVPKSALFYKGEDCAQMTMIRN